MCLSQKFTAANIAEKVWGIPRAKQYLSPSPSQSRVSSVPLVFNSVCLNECAGGKKKSSLSFLLNSDEHEKRQGTNLQQNCLLQIALLDTRHQSFECTFTCYQVSRYARLTFSIPPFVLGYDGHNTNNVSALTKRSLLRSTFGRLVRYPPVAISAPILDEKAAKRIAPGPSTPISTKPMTSEERNDAARKEKDQMRKIRKREAAARSNKRRSEAKRKKAAKPAGK